MNKSEKITAISLFCLIIAILFSNIVFAQNIFENIRSGELGERMGSILKENVFRYYTTVGGDLNPAYETQRLILDSILLFTFFLVIMHIAVDRVFKDAEKKIKSILTVIFAIVFTVSLLANGFSLGKLGPFIMPISFFIFSFILYLIISKMINADRWWKHLIAILIALLIVWFGMNAFNITSGRPLTLAGGFANTELPGVDYSKRIVALESAGGGAGLAELYYKQGLTEVQRYNYDAAALNFAKVIEIGPANNKYYKRAVEWLDEKLFIHMAKNYPIIMRGELEVAKIYLKNAKKIRTEPGGKEKAIELVKKAKELINDVEKKGALLRKESYEIAERRSTKK